MGNFEVDTRVAGEAGRYTASLSDDWAIWGPNGGYIASTALRAAGVESVFDRPASFQCQFLSAGRFDEVQIDVRSIRRGRNAEALGATIRQGEKTLLEAFVWTVPEADPALNGMEHDFSPAPKVPPASELTPVSVLQARHGLETRRFWENFERWPVNWTPPDEKQAGPPSFDCWYRFEPMARFDCPFTDAARSLLLIDTNGWPAAYGPYIEEQPLIAPSLDVAVQFHRDARESDLLLGEFEAPIATEAMIGTRGRVWDESGRLVASGGSQLLQRPAPQVPG